MPPVKKKFRTICPVSAVYNQKHIDRVGYNCPYKHVSYHWPATVSANFTLISDSICKFVKQTNQTFVQAFPGATTGGLIWKIGLGRVLLSSFRIIVLHIGTNDLGSSVQKILSDMNQLILTIRKTTSATIAISAIIPRPVDEKLKGAKRIQVNKELQKLCRSNENCKFLHTYRPFERSNKNLFACDGLHLNLQGVSVIKRFIISNIITLQGII